ncbi:MAG TPA: hypothetical protein VKE22_09900 [Haliangiales bacterium]|nr:hypothetical protein [Haliangiales bacterium]
MADDPKRPPVDDSATVRVPLVDETEQTEPRENTPPPLPPSPASAEADRWFEDAPTRPSALTDIAPSLPPRSGILSDPGNLPSEPAVPPAAAPTSWGLMGLVAATALAVGIVIGALIIRGC